MDLWKSEIAFLRGLQTFLGVCTYCMLPLYFQAKNWRYWSNIGCYRFNFERTVFFELTNAATPLATEGSQLCEYSVTVSFNLLVTTFEAKLFWWNSLFLSLSCHREHFPHPHTKHSRSDSAFHSWLNQGIKHKHPWGVSSTTRINNLALWFEVMQIDYNGILSSDA